MMETTVEVSGDDADQKGNESDLISDLQESSADSGPELVTKDCLVYSDTEEEAVNSACTKFWKKVGPLATLPRVASGQRPN